jgi:cell division transport system permease protein
MTLIIKEAVAAIRRTPIMAVMTSIVIAVCLGLCGIFAMLTKRANDSLEEFRAKLIIEAFFSPSIPSDEAKQVAYDKIKSTPDIILLQFISKEDALADYTKNSGEDVEGILGYNPLPASVRITFDNLTSIKAKAVSARILGIEGIKDVLFDEKSLNSLEKRSQTLYSLALVLGGILLVVSLTIVISTIRLAAHARADTIHAMQLLGAGRTTIILPYMLEGGAAGIVGGLLSGGLILLFHFFVIPAIAADLVTNISGTKDYLTLFGAGAMIGLMIGSIGGFAATWSSTRLA